MPFENDLMKFKLIFLEHFKLGEFRMLESILFAQLWLTKRRNLKKIMLQIKGIL